MKLIVGLGNPGSRYEQTRHNIGFNVIDRLVDELGASDISKSTFYGELFKHGDLLLVKPTTFMNLSGKSVQAVAHFYKIAPEQIIVIHDDIDLPFGAVRFKQGGSSGGHNGLKSIDTLYSNNYLRTRVGIGKPEQKSMVADYVLTSFSKEEQRCLDVLIAHTAKATLALSVEPLSEVQSNYSLKSADDLSC